MDAYYLDTVGRSYINSHIPKIKITASVSKRRFSDIKTVAETSDLKIGGFKVYRKEQTNEILTVYNNENRNLGLQTALSFAHRVVNRPSEKGKVPIHQDYSTMFSYCDRFNQLLFKCTWPFRHGGGRSYGEAGRLHDFAFTSILKNTYHIHILLNEKSVEKSSFFEKCIELSKELFEYANKMK